MPFHISSAGSSSALPTLYSLDELCQKFRNDTEYALITCLKDFTCVSLECFDATERERVLYLQHSDGLVFVDHTLDGEWEYSATSNDEFYRLMPQYISIVEESGGGYVHLQAEGVDFKYVVSSK